MAFAPHRDKGFRLASYKGGLVRAVDPYIGLALREAGADLDIEIASGTVVKDGKVVSPTINYKEKVAVDGWAAGSVGTEACIGNGSRYSMKPTGARVRYAGDDPKCGVSHGQ